jgi:hypothetical protein
MWEIDHIRQQALRALQVEYDPLVESLSLQIIEKTDMDIVEAKPFR